MPKPSGTPLVAVTRRIIGELDAPGGGGGAGAQVQVLAEDLRPRKEVLSFIKGADVVVAMFTDRVDEEFLDAAGPQLKAICHYAVGYDNIDLEACKARNVVVTNIPHAVTEGTADLAWTLIMAVARRLIEADRYARSPQYPQNGPLGMAEFLGMDLTGRTLLIVGAGRIGYATALRSIGWGMKILYVARSRHPEFEFAPLAAERIDLDQGLAQADVVSIHTPLTDETRHLINAQRLALMKPTAILVNTARGPIIDEAALVEALKEKRIWGAGLDVFENEPTLHPGLIEAQNATLTPHIGSGEERYRRMMTAICFENVRAVLENAAPPNAIC